MSETMKNPFGIRNGQYITIGDLTMDDRGAKCNCVCPDCGGKFVARIGEIRKPHFAHEKDSMCDTEKVIMNSLYSFLCDAISEQKCFTYPGCYGYFAPGFDNYRKATLEEIKSVVSFSNTEQPPEADYDTIIEKNRVPIISTELSRNSKGIPQALLVKHIAENGKEHVLAVQIILPENFCKTFKAKQYTGYPTVAIQVTEDLYHIKSEALKARLRDGSDMKQWVSSAKIDGWLNKQLAKQHDAYAKWCEEEKQRIALRKQMQLARMEQQRKAAIEQQRRRAAMLEREKERARKAIQLDEERAKQVKAFEIQFSERLSQEYPTPPVDRLVRDVKGNRWVYCDDCSKWHPDFVMVYYGGAGERMNRGVCRWCKNQTRQ